MAELSYDPCTKVADASISAPGFDPGTKKPHQARVGTATEAGCSWDDSATLPRLGLDIGRSLSTVKQCRCKQTFTGVTELIIGGGAAVNFATITAGGGCNLTINLTIKITGGTGTGTGTGIGYIGYRGAVRPTSTRVRTRCRSRRPSPPCSRRTDNVAGAAETHFDFGVLARNRVACSTVEPGVVERGGVGSVAGWFSGVEAAIGGAAAGALRSQSEWAGLKAQAAAGTLRMEPGAAEACAAACQAAHEALTQELGNTRQLSRVHGLGSWQSGESIAQKFRDKAGADNPSGNSAGGVIRSHRDVLLEMRDTFRSAGQAYAAAEQANADRLRGLS